MESIISLFSSLYRKIASVFTSILVALGLVAGTVVPSGDAIVFKNSDEVKMSAIFLSDLHIKDDTVSVQQLTQALSDIKSSSESFDVLALTGDITDGGDVTSFNLAWNALEGAKLSSVILPAMGNHDTWADFSTAKSQITARASKYTGKKIDKTYYSYDAKGYTFIVLGSEAQNEKAYISSAQLSFLDSELARATKDGKPAFIVAHQPLADTHGLPEVWATGGDLGAQSYQVRVIFTKYKNVFFLNGHLHTGIYEKSFEILDEEKGVYSLNMPSYGKSSTKGEYKQTGLGVYMEVYDNEVIFTARDFRAGKVLEGYSKTIPLK